MRFVDTNILLYSLGNEPDQEKARVARRLLDERDLALSVQVLQEFYVQATREGRADALTHEQASRLVESFLRFPVQELTVDIVQAAMDTSRRFQVSYWDAAILEAARALGCEVVLSEDLNSGQEYGGVRVKTPFAGASL